METLQKRAEWFDVECKNSTMEKNEAYKKMQQRSGTTNSRNEYQGKRRDEKRIHRKKKNE
jgi:hypothetical protein